MKESRARLETTGWASALSGIFARLGSKLQALPGQVAPMASELWHKTVRKSRWPRSRSLFPKYAALLVALVGGTLIINSAIEMYYSYGESRQALIAVQREKALGAAAVILHRMWVDGTDFRWSAKEATA